MQNLWLILHSLIVMSGWPLIRNVCRQNSASAVEIMGAAHLPIARKD